MFVINVPNFAVNDYLNMRCFASIIEKIKLRATITKEGSD